MKELLEILDPRQHPGMAVFVSQVLLRLLTAAFLGGAIGLEREVKGKPAGLRTNMFICFGSAMYTILSERLASDTGGDHTRIAAQIIPGIGFIGAGAILHSKAGVQGLTTAATMFVVASIGMAAGGGLYLPALFSTLVLLIALHALGLVERRLNFKPLEMTYEAEGDTADGVLSGINQVLDEVNVPLRSMQVARFDDRYRVVFSVAVFRNQHADILKGLRGQAAVRHFNSISAKEED